MTLLRWLTFLLRSQTVILTVFLFRISFFLLTLVFVVQWLSLHWEIQIQGYIQAILMSGRRHKKLNLLIEFSNSTFIKFYFKACWCLKICIRNKCAYEVFFLFEAIYLSSRCKQTKMFKGFTPLTPHHDLLQHLETPSCILQHLKTQSLFKNGYK